MAVKALLFDVFGTVVDWRTSLVDELGAWGTARGLDVDWPGFVDAWRRAYAPSMARVRRGELPWTNLDALHRASLDALAPQFGLDGLDEAARDWVNRGWHRLRPWPDSVAGLRRLKQRFVVSPLSNGNVALLTNMAKHAGLPWDLVLCAELFRHYKPDPETYLGAAGLLGLEPGAVMLCAAHNADLAAARSLGLATAFILRPTEYGPDQVADRQAEQAWDCTVESIEELADVLEACDLRAQSEPPASPALAALWWAARDEWARAHEAAQADDGADAAWVHAHLHRVEGDLENARYWYGRAGRPEAVGTLPAEWARIAAALVPGGMLRPEAPRSA